jgi:hypothetical protein
MKQSLPDDLRALQARFQSWRETRSKREPIPQDLLQEARAMLSRYSMWKICRACRLHATSLRQTRGGRQTTQKKKTAPRRTDTTQAFFPLTPPQLPTAEPRACQVRLERTDGAALTFTLTAPDNALLTGLAQEFLKGGRL